MTKLSFPEENSNKIVIAGFDVTLLTPGFVLAHSHEMPDTTSSRFFNIHPETIAINTAVFSNPGGNVAFPFVEVEYRGDALTITCTCNNLTPRFCAHQSQVLYNILQREDLRIFFDAELRHKIINPVAANYGLEQEKHLDAHFEVVWKNKALSVTPINKNLQPITEASIQLLTADILPPKKELFESAKGTPNKTVLIFGAHKYYKHLQVGIYSADFSKAGKLKKVRDSLDPMEQVWQSNDAPTLKFFYGVAAFSNNHAKKTSAADLKALQAIVRNPVAIPAFSHDAAVSEEITVPSLVPVSLDMLNAGIALQVYQKGDYYEISGKLEIEEMVYPLNQLHLKYGYFVATKATLYLPSTIELFNLFRYFKSHNNLVVVHQTKFEMFRKTILANLEDSIKITYAWLVAATQEQLEENGFDVPPGKLIYLSDAGQYITISPVVRYGEVEVSTLSKRQLFARDQKGNAFIVDRDESIELDLTVLLLKQRPEFSEQLHQEAFYLTKADFLADGWFLDAFEEWRKHEVKILGFQEIDQKRLNTNKATVSVVVTSGQDWFDTDLDVRYGKQKASLRQLHKSLKNGNQYVTLDDGTLGLLPAAWIAQMKQYFEAGSIADEIIRTPKTRLSLLDQLYQPEMLSREIRSQLEKYRHKLANFEAIENVDLPPGLNAVLRGYQQQGLNWLGFLDEFGFGGCLADDMGLGKTIQVIAFMLSRKTSSLLTPHLVVVPASLVFNWEEEFKKFAPGIKVLTIHGNKRVKTSLQFSGYDVVLTSYGMLQPAMHIFKTFRFYYIFLDESQAIKNPDSQRHKSVCMLQSFNRVVLTGTPIENNSYDLYGQLSFACPGLLGSPQYFKDVYLQPIDKFGDSKRAAELQQIVAPFILRRTKKQVAPELPEKTEMILYCEMGVEQRKVYDAYEKEFRNYLLHKPEEDLSRDSMNVLQGLTKLRQVCNSPALLKDPVFFGEASAKLDVLIEQVQSKYKQHKILIFSQFVSVLDLVKKELAAKYIPFAYLTGQTKNREAVVNSFRNNDEIRVFLVSLKAGGTGLNLTEADYVYLVDPWWNPAVENQAIDRCYRIGQEKHVVAVRLICPGTVEEKIMELQASKKELVKDLVKTDQGMMKQFNKADLLSLVNHIQSKKD